MAKFCISNADFILCEGNGEILISDPAVIPKADNRIGAIVALAPVGRAIFNPESLALISVPVYLYAAANDHILPPNDNVHYLKENLKSSVIVKIIPDAGHFVFLSPCSEALINEFPDLCIDPPGIDRTDVHEKLIRDIVNFFDNSL